MAYTKYSLTPANNNAAPPDGAPEGMLPSAVNDTMRDMMAQIRDCGDGIRGGTYTMTAPVITGGSINGTTVGASTASTGAFTTLAYTGTLTGGTGVVNIGSGQIYKDADGKVGIGTSSPDVNLRVTGSTATVSSQPNVTARFGPSVDSDLLVGSITGNAPFIASQGAYPLLMYTNATERMRISSTGNVGIGTSSPSAQLETSYSFDGKSDTTAVILGGTDDGFAFTGVKVGYKDTNSLSSDGSYPLQVFTNNVQQMRVSGAGNVSFGTPYTGAGAQTSLQVSATDNYIIYSNAATTSSLIRQYFFNPNGTVGSISTSGSSTSYATSSDYRLKENVAPMVGALDTIAQLKPCTYTWKADGEAGQGFIAHELQAVIPQAVSGEKDAINEDGTIKPQGIDTSYVVATLTAAIQELKAELDSVKTELATLKA